MPITNFDVQFQDPVFANSGENAHGKLIASWQFSFIGDPRQKLGAKSKIHDWFGFCNQPMRG